MLLQKGIIYAPDFLINAGGLINVYAEHLGGYNRDLAYQQADKIYDTCISILDKSAAENIPAQQAAIEMAWNRIQAMGRVKLSH
jgi:leucine dehydrogenase